MGLLRGSRENLQICWRFFVLDHFRPKKIFGELADSGSIGAFAPVELEGFAWSKGQRNESATTGRPGRFLLRLSPIPGEGSDPVIGAFITQRGKVGIDLPQISPLLAILLRFRLEPCGQLRRKQIKLARAMSLRIFRLDDASAQILPDRVSGQARSPGNFTDGHAIPQVPAPDYAYA